MKFIPQTVEEYISKVERGQKRDKQIVSVAVQMLEAVEEMHEKSLSIHRDIKTSNFMMAGENLYLIDFGLATEWFKNDAHIKQEVDQGFQGSLQFASTWTHEGITQSRRDDLQMIGFTIL